MTKVCCFLGIVLLAISPSLAQGLSFDSAGTKIHYEVIGSGEPVVLIHGFAVSGKTNWGMGGVFEKLSRDYQVILMDARGHGRSEKPHDTAEYGLNMVDDVVRLLDHLKIERAHIAGYSMGGLITFKLATLHPDRLKSACVCAAAWLRPDQPEAPDFIAAVSQSLEAGNGPLPLLKRLNPSQDPVTQARVNSTNSVLKLMNDSKALSAAIRSFPSLAIAEEDLLSCKVPIQFLIGTKDPAPTSVEQLKKVAPQNFKIVEIKNGDHVSTIAADAFYENLTEFFKQHR